MSLPMLYEAAGLFETLKPPGLTFSDGREATVLLFKAEQESIAGQLHAFRYSPPSAAHTWETPMRDQGEDYRTYGSRITAEATKRVWPGVKWMLPENIPAMYDVVVVDYPNNLHTEHSCCPQPQSVTVPSTPESSRCP